MPKSNVVGKQRRRRRAIEIQPGAAPGSVIRKSVVRTAPVQALAFGPDGIEEVTQPDGNTIAALCKQWPIVWINVDGIRDPDTLLEMQQRFDLHPLAVEDVANLGQRPKLEAYDRHLFLIASMPARNSEHHAEQVSMFVGDGLVLTFQEKPGDCFEPVRERLRAGKGRIRRLGPDYLAYALLDSVVDNYFPVLERVGRRLEELEDQILASTSADIPAALQEVRGELRELRRMNLPQRELVAAMQQHDTTFVNKGTKVFLRDCLDHAVRVSELVDAFREESADLMHLHLAMMSNKMNEVMKVLTIMAAIFIPLSFIAGLYGMNFNADVPWNMPELTWRWGYPAVLALMAAVAGGLIVFFKRRDWF